MAEHEPLRFADILTTASAVANYLGETDVRAAHLLQSIAILRGERSMDDLGRPTSPLVRRPSPPGATEAVRELVQRWFADLGEDANALLDDPTLRRLVSEIEALES
jgi:hypothetical protein